METLIEHRIEPEVAGPAPRNVTLPWRSSVLLGMAALLLGLFVLGSGWALWEGTKLAWLTQYGRTVSAKIVDIRTEPAARKGQGPRQTAFRYAGTVPGPKGLLAQSGWVDLNTSVPGAESTPAQTVPMPAFSLGQAFPLRYARFFSMTWSQPWGPDPGSRILTLFLAGGLVLAVSLLLLRRLVRWTQRRLNLLRHGTATVGTITHTRFESEDMVRYFLRYGYSVGAGEGREHEEQVSADQWRRFHVGQPVTVLSDPQDPKRVGLYLLIG